MFFKEEVEQLKQGKTTSSYACSKAEGIFSFVRSPTNQLYSTFLLYSVKAMEPSLLKFQSEEPQIHLLWRHIQGLYRQILKKFVKPSAMPACVSVEAVNFRLPANQKSDAELSIGEGATSLIEKKEENHLRDSRIK